ncbi:uncharacterized protein LOC130392445 isoform X2 [Gadus chalcogrammus]|uniref:uncharacterized protein LOC130392445 isoform X2 n=1 Tax=Gadus chalcogrammus TaxID=1042646 RepID=UPI0024C49927|nr:uncharacterized protein LOC130392445 isoform X2 [Gadus chalcogrammus]
MQEDRGRSQRPGLAAGLLCGILFVGSALLVLCSSYRSLDGNQQRVGRSLAGPKTGPSCYSPPPEKPVAFLRGPKKDRKSPSCGRTAVVQWAGEPTLRGGFKYDEKDRLVVPIEGRYWVYFQLNYSGGLQGMQSCRPLIITQGVVWVRESYTVNQTLLQAQDTVTEPQHTFSKTLQASAAFDLAAGDLLFVVTNSPELLSTEGYLGADLEL